MSRCHTEWRTFFSIYLGVIFTICRSHVARHSASLKLGSHAQRTPLNMGALRRVTADNIYHYRARTCETIEEVRLRHRPEPCTRGFQPAVSRSETRTLWIRFTTASRGGKQAERARGDAQPQPRQSRRPSQLHVAWHGSSAQGCCPPGASAAAAAARSCIAGCWVLHTWPRKKLCVEPYGVTHADQKFTAQLRRKKPARLRRDSEPREPPVSHKSGMARVAQPTYAQENASLQRVAAIAYSAK